ncbi:MAG: hypothetical protein JXB29_06175 [Sedimentisphaerales bacterium]|nr:hypothetical protein [Sedimentisphaerales bacterium]
MKSIVLPMLVFCFLAASSQAEFQVNTYTTSFQHDPAIAIDGADNFIVAWNSYGQDSNSGGIFGQRFLSNSELIGGEFPVNTTTYGNQRKPSVAVNDAGNFVVVCQGPQSTLQEDEDIFARRLDANGQPINGEFIVNTYTDNRQICPKVAMNKTGAFAVTWERHEVYSSLEVTGISCQLYDSNGSTIGNEIQVESFLGCRYPDVAMDDNGDFTVVWMQEKNAYYNSNVVLARQYNDDGSPKGQPLEVSVTGFNTVTRPAIDTTGNGHFVVAWSSRPNNTDYYNVYARRYKFDGTSLTDEFIVNTTPSVAQQRPAAAMNNQRQFVILWNSGLEPNETGREVLGQKYDEFYNPIGDEFIINTYVVGDQRYPAVAIKPDGRFIAVWQSDYQDGSEYGIFGELGPKIVAADFTFNGFVDFKDYCILADEWLHWQNPLKADLIDDNIINQKDLAAFCRQYLTFRCDCSAANLYDDGIINLKDYCLWARDWQRFGPSSAGDIDGNGINNLLDLSALKSRWTAACGE